MGNLMYYTMIHEFEPSHWLSIRLVEGFSGGLIGVGLFGWFLVTLIQRTRHAMATFIGIQRVLAVGAIIGVVGVGVHSLVDFGLHITGNALVFVMLLGLLSVGRIDQRPVAQEHRSAAFN